MSVDIASIAPEHKEKHPEHTRVLTRLDVSTYTSWMKISPAIAALKAFGGDALSSHRDYLLADPYLWKRTHDIFTANLNRGPVRFDAKALDEASVAFWTIQERLNTAGGREAITARALALVERKDWRIKDASELLFNRMELLCLCDDLITSAVLGTPRSDLARLRNNRETIKGQPVNFSIQACPELGEEVPSEPQRIGARSDRTPVTPKEAQLRAALLRPDSPREITAEAFEAFEKCATFLSYATAAEQDAAKGNREILLLKRAHSSAARAALKNQLKDVVRSAVESSHRPLVGVSELSSYRQFRQHKRYAAATALPKWQSEAMQTSAASRSMLLQTELVKELFVRDSAFLAALSQAGRHDETEPVPDKRLAEVKQGLPERAAMMLAINDIFQCLLLDLTPKELDALLIHETSAKVATAALQPYAAAWLAAPSNTVISQLPPGNTSERYTLPHARDASSSATSATTASTSSASIINDEAKAPAPISSNQSASRSLSPLKDWPVKNQEFFANIPPAPQEVPLRLTPLRSIMRFEESSDGLGTFVSGAAVKVQAENKEDAPKPLARGAHVASQVHATMPQASGQSAASSASNLPRSEAAPSRSAR